MNKTSAFIALTISMLACQVPNLFAPTPEIQYPPMVTFATEAPADEATEAPAATELPEQSKDQNFQIQYETEMPKGFRIWAGDTLLCMAEDSNTYYVIISHGKAVINNPQICGFLNKAGNMQFADLSAYKGDQLSINQDTQGNFALQLGREKPTYSAGPIITEWHPLYDNPEKGLTGISSQFVPWAEAIVAKNAAKDIWSILDVEHNRPMPFGKVLFYHQP